MVSVEDQTLDISSIDGMISSTDVSVESFEHDNIINPIIRTEILWAIII